MKALDFYWMSNKEWTRIENGQIVIKEDAPQKAQESYKRYLKQLTENLNAI